MNCLNCKFFQEFPRQDETKNDTIGACCFNPPIAKEKAIAVFPTVLGSMWCGAFEYPRERKEESV